MGDEIEQLMIEVRASTSGFTADVATMRASFDSILVDGFGRAGEVLERGLLSAIRRGGVGFEDLRRIALSVIGDIAARAIQSGIGAIGGLGGGGAGGGGGGVLGFLRLGGDDGLEVLALSALLARAAIRGVRDLLRLVDGRLLDVGAIHRGLPRHALAHGRRRGGEVRCAIRPSR